MSWTLRRTKRESSSSRFDEDEYDLGGTEEEGSMKWRSWYWSTLLSLSWVRASALTGYIIYQIIRQSRNIVTYAAMRGRDIARAQYGHVDASVGPRQVTVHEQGGSLREALYSWPNAGIRRSMRQSIGRSGTGA